MRRSRKGSLTPQERASREQQGALAIEQYVERTRHGLMLRRHHGQTEQPMKYRIKTEGIRTYLVRDTIYDDGTTQEIKVAEFFGPTTMGEANDIVGALNAALLERAR